MQAFTNFSGFNKNHILFYSASDDDFYVAIQDGLTGTVVTVLPLEYHANLARKIPPEDCVSAKQIYFNAPAEALQCKSESSAASFAIRGHYLDGEGNEKTKSLHTVKSAQYVNDAMKFLADQAFFRNLKCLPQKRESRSKKCSQSRFALANGDTGYI